MDWFDLIISKQHVFVNKKPHPCRCGTKSTNCERFSSFVRRRVWEFGRFLRSHQDKEDLDCLCPKDNQKKHLAMSKAWWWYLTQASLHRFPNPWWIGYSTPSLRQAAAASTVFPAAFFAIRSPIVIESPPRKYDTLIPMIFPYPKTDFCTLFCVKKVHSALFILHFRKKVISR